MVTYNELKPLKLRDQPFDNIGANDICSVETNYKGFLNKEGKVERNLQKLVSHVPWRRYFVVLSQGCVYVFQNEHAAKPKVKFSLRNYHKLQRNFSIPFSFEILPCISDGKVYRFQCDDEADRLDWMRALYVSLLAVHKEPLPSNDVVKHFDKQHEYGLVESAVGTAGEYQVDDSSSSDEDNNYDKPDESLKKDTRKTRPYVKDPTSVKMMPLPEIPHTDEEDRHGPPVVKSSGAATSETKSHVKRMPLPELPRTEQEDTRGSPLGKPTGAAASETKSQSVNSRPSSPDQSNHPGQYQNASKKVPKPKSSNKKPTPSPKPNIQKPTPSPKPNIQQSTLKPMLNTQQYANKLPLASDTDTEASYQNSLTDNPKKKDSDGPYLNLDGAMNQDDDPDVEYMFYGSKEEAASELHLTDPGTFLIRDSSEPNRKVLVVQVNTGLASYKCECNKDGFYYLDSSSHFKSYHELVEHYKKYPLPKRSLTLLKGFNATDSPRPVSKPQEGAYEPVEPPKPKHK